MRNKTEYRSLVIDGVEMTLPIKREGRYLYAQDGRNRPLMMVGFINERKQEEYLPNVEEGRIN